MVRTLCLLCSSSPLYSIVTQSKTIGLPNGTVSSVVGQEEFLWMSLRRRWVNRFCVARTLFPRACLALAQSSPSLRNMDRSSCSFHNTTTPREYFKVWAIVLSNFYLKRTERIEHKQLTKQHTRRQQQRQNLFVKTQFGLDIIWNWIGVIWVIGRRIQRKEKFYFDVFHFANVLS